MQVIFQTFDRKKATDSADEAEGEFHGPEAYREQMERAAMAEGVEEPEIVPIVVRRGGGSIHHGWTWHGSAYNPSDRPRRSLVLHALSSEAQFVPEYLDEGIGPIYGRYKRLADNVMDENYFPILWTRDGQRTAALDALIREEHVRTNTDFSDNASA